MTVKTARSRNEKYRKESKKRLQLKTTRNTGRKFILSLRCRSNRDLKGGGGKEHVQEMRRGGARKEGFSVDILSELEVQMSDDESESSAAVPRLYPATTWIHNIPPRSAEGTRAGGWGVIDGGRHPASVSTCSYSR